MQTGIPQLRMTDADRSLALYAALGVTVDWEHRFDADMPLFAQLARDVQTIFLSGHAGDCALGGAVYFKVRDVDACARAFAAAGVPIVTTPWDTDWGTREMLLVDPDHNRLRFAQHAD